MQSMTKTFVAHRLPIDYSLISLMSSISCLVYTAPDCVFMHVVDS